MAAIGLFPHFRNHTNHNSWVGQSQCAFGPNFVASGYSILLARQLSYHRRTVFGSLPILLATCDAFVTSIAPSPCGATHDNPMVRNLPSGLSVLRIHSNFRFFLAREVDLVSQFAQLPHQAHGCRLRPWHFKCDWRRHNERSAQNIISCKTAPGRANLSKTAEEGPAEEG